MRWRVVDTYYEYLPTDTVIADWLTRAEAKCIYRHYLKKFRNNDMINDIIRVEVLTEDGAWKDMSWYWINIELEQQEIWFEERGLDYEWWLEFGEIKKLG